MNSNIRRYWTNSRGSDWVSDLWGLLWVLCIKMAANGEYSCCRHVFAHRRGGGPGTVARQNSYQYRGLPPAFPANGQPRARHLGGRDVYDSALGFLSLVFRIHGVQPDAPTGSQFQRPVAGRGANQTERRGPREAPG